MSSSVPDSIVALTQALVRIPTRAGMDAYGPLFAALGSWLRERGVEAEEVRDAEGRTQALAARIEMGRPGPALILNATVDTAPFGDEAMWSAPPTSGDILEGWLHGRGAADSKAGVALFSQLGARFAADKSGLAGALHLLFDAGEHTGEFSGVRAFFEDRARPDDVVGVLIGYPGDGKLVVGCRGFLRASLHARGRSAHSGGVSERGQNAVEKAARLVELLAASRPAARPTPDFPLPPELTVTGVEGGEGFSVVPDRCRVDVDVRLTPDFGAEQARELLAGCVERIDRDAPTDAPTLLETFGGWPAYRLGADSPLVRAMQAAAAEVLGAELPARVVGPSNVGNYLATLGIEATAGYGVRYRNLHGVDEALEVASVEPVYRVYERAIRTLLAGA